MSDNEKKRVEVCSVVCSAIPQLVEKMHYALQISGSVAEFYSDIANAAMTAAARALIMRATDSGNRPVGDLAKARAAFTDLARAVFDMQLEEYAELEAHPCKGECECGHEPKNTKLEN
jgi:hypothetical protein